MNFRDYLQDNYIVFDGAMGTMLQEAGLKPGDIPETYNLLQPDVIRHIHKCYVEAGADVATTNTFQANELKLVNCPYSVEEIITAGVTLAKDSGAKWTALDIGPLGQLMEPLGTISFERAYDIFKRQIIAGVKAGADIILIETISDLYEAKAAILAAKENSSLPVLCTMTFQADGRTFVGTDSKTAVIALQGLGIDGIGVNCSLGPEELLPIVSEMLQYAKIPVMVQPNAGLPRIHNGATVYDVTPEEFSGHLEAMALKGARILGGCCGTNPRFINALNSIVKGNTPVSTVPKTITAACSYSKTVEFNGKTTVIGERINPTGKKRLKDALINGNMDYIISEAITQVNNGADILDVNAGIPEINEADTVKKLVKELQGIVTIPLQIDSSNAEVVEKAVRIYNGKPVINSVNGNDEVLKSILPIVKKYGALVVALTLDNNGIPSSAEERYKIAERIVIRAEKYGIPREDILIDCLVLTASAHQNEVMETVKAIRLVKERLKTKTVLGVSNVSFGLPARPILNSTYLAVTLGAGLDAAILNPGSSEIMDVIHAFKVLNNEDKEAKEFLDIYGKRNTELCNTTPAAISNLTQIIIEGRKEEAYSKTKEVLNEYSSLTIINEFLIPALDIVGRNYEKGHLFLPQLIQSAEAAKNSFEAINNYEAANSCSSPTKHKILLAVVKGDIHDIGKNIVKMLLENYGYEVIDLGKDVQIQDIIKIAKEKDVRLIGLSALMTTTVKNMEDTIKAIREANIPCSIMVGGAVLNEEYAKMAGADYYAKDAREGVNIANRIFHGESM